MEPFITSQDENNVIQPTPPRSAPASGRILAIDFGTKHFGLAISDEQQRFAQTLEHLTTAEPTKAQSFLNEIVERNHVKAILISYPLGIQSKPTQISIQVEKFAAELAAVTGLPYVLWNETGTSQMAGRGLSPKNRHKVHSEAARIMLQEYLDFRNTGI